MMPVYNTFGNAYFPRSCGYSQLASKASYANPWYTNEASSADNFRANQSNQHISHDAANTKGDTYSTDFRCFQTHGKTSSSAGNYAEHDSMAIFSSHHIPCTPSDFRVATSEAFSPLDMASLHSTLPERPYTRTMHVSDCTVPRRQLPVPQPSPSQTTRNVVDQMQDQRLRSIGAPPPKDGVVKPPIPYSSGNDAKNAAGIKVEIETALERADTSMPIPTENSTKYIFVPTSLSEDSSRSAQAVINFGTSPLLDALSTARPHATYSNFRDHNLTVSSSHDHSASLARQVSQSNYYSFTTDNNPKRHSTSDVSAVSSIFHEQNYTPIESTSIVDAHADNLYTSRATPMHRASTSDLHRGF
jgi:hypothetical protein